MALKTRQPTGQVPPPVILLEGETGSGRSWTAAELSASPKVGRTYWIELGDESTADQYGAIPGARYEIVEPDRGVWDWQALCAAARAFRDESRRAAEAGELPPALVVDQVGAVWDMLAEWADNRARSSKKNREILAEDPNAEIDITSNFWNDATTRWRKIMSFFLTTRGIVVLLSRGEEVTLFENGQPTKRKTWKVAGQKSLPAAMPIWVRMSRDGNPKLIKLRAVTGGIRPGVDREQGLPGFTLEKLIFERYGWRPAASGHRQFTPMVAGAEAPDSLRYVELIGAVEETDDPAELRRLWTSTKVALDARDITPIEADRLREAMRAKAPAANQPMSEQQRTQIEDLIQQSALDQETGMKFIGEIIHPDVVTGWTQLTAAQAEKVIDRMTRFLLGQDPAGGESA